MGGLGPVENSEFARERGGGMSMVSKYLWLKKEFWSRGEEGEHMRSASMTGDQSLCEMGQVKTTEL